MVNKGDIIAGTVCKVVPYGIFVGIENEEFSEVLCGELSSGCGLNKGTYVEVEIKGIFRNKYGMLMARGEILRVKC